MFFRILSQGGRLELLKSKASYTTCSMRTIKSVPDRRFSLPLIEQVQNHGHPPKYGFSTGIWVILCSVSLSLYFLFCLQKCQSSLFIVMFVSLLNTIEQLFFPVLIKVLNLLILFIWMCGDLHLSVIFLLQCGLFLLLITALGLLGYFS